jgi:hypothetical protein
MSHATSTDSERRAYYVVRIGLAAAGAFVILATLSSHFIMPGLLYDEAPGPPPLRERLPAIIVLIGAGLLLGVPHRWTRAARSFGIRMAASILLTGFLFWRAGWDFSRAARGGDVRDFSRGALFVGVALAVPLTLWWSRRFGRER